MIRCSCVLLSILACATAATAQVPEQSVVPPAETVAPTQPAVPSRVGIALVIGNSRYAQAELPSVATDRETMARVLKSLGFSVREVEDLQRPRDFQDALRSFLRDQEAAPEDTLVVYYSGHGLQIDGKAYLLGTGIKMSGDMSAAIREFSESVDEVIRTMEDAAPSARVLIVDACRNNAFATTPRKAGTAFQRAVEDTYILFADEPGKTVPARSETSRQSPFTAGLLYALENSNEGLEKRFEIVREKTHDLNPDQNPQMLKSDTSVDRNRPFLDHGGRAAPSHSAGQMLNDAEELYRIGSWNDFRDKIRAARVLSSEAALNARLDRELSFCDDVVAARAAETDAAGPRWADAGAAWQKAAGAFPARAWVLEREALSWLLADRMQEAAEALTRLRAHTGSPFAERATRLLTGLFQADPSLEATVKAFTVAAPNAGPEFEKYLVEQR
jgi:hypothetical protein